ncbi:MAG TPA: bifunctional protein-serine/threonine kinase/phosphatase [Gallionella sp.]|nr:bifunctional protein-serine/threonine kinase/phosphatase [Gallionella sp.]
MALAVSSGHVSATGSRASNEDFCGIVMPEGRLLETKGIIAAVADGVGSSGGGREAAEYSVRGLLADYNATPDTWAIPHALDRVLRAINRWLLAQSFSRPDNQQLVSTLSTIVLQGDRYVIGHIGDSRIYLLRDGQLRVLTVDHVWDQPGMQHVLKRAMGLDQHLVLDYSDDVLHVGDVFLLASDGVWEAAGDVAIEYLLTTHRHDVQRAAEELVREALIGKGGDNATALVLRVDQVGTTNRHYAVLEAQNLAVPERLKVGQVLDEFEVMQLLHESQGSLLYQVKHTTTQQILVLKTLPQALQHDVPSREGLLVEEWLAKSLISHYFPQVLPLTQQQRHHLYYVMSFHEGATLQQHLKHSRHFSIAEAIQIGIRLGKALGMLHRRNIIHRDIKPDNIHLDTEGKLRLLDLGVALNPATMRAEGVPGTPSFIAPELFAGQPPSNQSDLYAVGVTIYYLLTRKYPYGEIEPFQHPRFTEPLPPTRYRPDIPQWLEGVLLKAVAKDPLKRFETAEEWVITLGKGEHDAALPYRRGPLSERDPLRLWQLGMVFSVLLNLLLLYLLWVT